MLKNSTSVESFCSTCQEFKFKYSKLKDLYRTQKLHISELEDVIRQQKLDVAHAKQIADDEKTNADLLRGTLIIMIANYSKQVILAIGTIHSLNVSHLQANIEAKRELDSTSQKLTLQIDREKASKAELKAQLNAAIAGILFILILSLKLLLIIIL